MEKVYAAVDKLLRVLLNYEWQAISIGLAFRPFDWRTEVGARKFYVVGQLGPIKVWAGVN